MKILVSYRGIPQSPGWATGDMAVKAFRALGHDVFPYAKYYQQDRWAEQRIDPHGNDWDLILFMECNDGDPQYVELKDVRAKHKACWLFDTSYYRDQCRGLIDFFKFDSIFLANPITIRQYEQWGYKNVRYLPYAYDPELHCRPLETPKVRDVALIGSIREDRLQLKRALSYSGIELELIGGLFREQYIDALAATRVIINQNPDQGLGLLNMRHFEAQAAGCLLIEQAWDMLPNVEAGFKCYSEIQITVPDLIETLDVWKGLSQDPLEHAAFLTEHSYQARCQRILEVVNG